MMALLLGAGKAPGWVILPAAAVLGYTVLLYKRGTDLSASGVDVALVAVCTVASLFAAAAVVWWVAAVA